MKKIIITIVKKLLTKIFYNKYVVGFPELKNSVLSEISPMLISHNIEIIDYRTDNNLVCLKKDNLYLFTTPEYPHIMVEIFCCNTYFINPMYLKREEYLVIDMGMNRGYASLYFANQPWCKKVVSFELNETIFDLAQKNLDINKGLKNKIEAHNVGLGAKDERITTYYIPHRDGICTTSKEFLTNYAPGQLKYVVETESSIKKASVAVKEILEKNSDVSIVLKMDVEGAEYDIVNNIIKEYPLFFDRVEVIIGEAHLGLKPLVDAFKPFNFKQISTRNFIPKAESFLFVKNN